MRKLITMLLIAALLLPALALADLPDISGLSYDELVQLKDKINLAMWNSEKWQEVTVPAGVWTVGEDIPVGHWSISLSPDVSSSWASITYCDLLDASGTDAGNRFDCDIYAYLDVAGPTNDNYPKVIDLDLKPGTYIIIGHGSVVFTPYQGKPSLGFK
jgi:hypothetical protein